MSRKLCIDEFLGMLPEFREHCDRWVEITKERKYLEENLRPAKDVTCWIDSLENGHIKNDSEFSFRRHASVRRDD